VLELPNDMAKKAAPKAAQGKAAPAPAAKAPPKPADTPAPARPKPANRTVVYSTLAETTGLGKKEVAAVFSALSALIAKELGKKGPGQFVVPDLLKLKVVRKPATKARPGTNPFTGEPMTIWAKPARNVVRALPMKALKEMVWDGGAGWRQGGYRGPRQKVASRLGGTADQVSKGGRPSGARRASPGRCRRPGRPAWRPPAPPRPGLDASAGQVHFRHDRQRGALTARLHHRHDGDPGDHLLGAAAVNLAAGLRLIFWGPGDALPTGNPQEVAMSPLLLIVFIPLFVGGVAFVALLFAAATAGSREAFEERPQEGTTAAEEVLSRVAPSEPSSARAA
jgi:nucleoid DNA-binding protein